MGYDLKLVVSKQIVSVFDLKLQVATTSFGTPLPAVDPYIPNIPPKPVETVLATRTSVSSFQSRAGRFHDRIRRKMVDNAVYWTGEAIDCIRVRINKSKQGDILSRVIEGTDVVPIIFPPLKDVPYRRVMKAGTALTLETLPAATELFPFTISTTQYHKLQIDDLVFRILKDPLVDLPIMQVLQITEQKADFGIQSIIMGKFDCVYYNESLPDEMLSLVAQMAERRLHLKF